MTLPTTIPLWLVALVLAAIAPWCVRAFSDAMERRLRDRTASVLARQPHLAGTMPRSIDSSETPSSPTDVGVTGADRDQTGEVREGERAREG